MGRLLIAPAREGILAFATGVGGGAVGTYLASRSDAPFVAYPDGTKREANEDEKIMFARRRSRPFRKIV